LFGASMTAASMTPRMLRPSCRQALVVLTEQAEKVPSRLQLLMTIEVPSSLSPCHLYHKQLAGGIVVHPLLQQKEYSIESWYFAK
jgi:hypothetical protein